MKGLRTGEILFYLLVLSPSEDELAHTSSGPAKLEAYTWRVMDKYAQNFKLKGGQ